MLEYTESQFNRFKRLSPYSKSVIISWILGSILSIYFIIFSPLSYVLAIFASIFIISAILSCSTYLARLLMSWRKKTWVDFWMTLIGTLFGVFIATLSCIYLIPHFVGTLSYLAFGLFFVTCISLYAGFMNRMVAHERPPTEQWIMRVTAAFALVGGGMIYYFGIIGSVTVTDVTGFFTVGIGFMPLWPIFILSFASAVVSISDYSCKTFIFIYVEFLGGKNEKLRDRVKKRKSEYAGSCYGSAAGFCIGGGTLLVFAFIPASFLGPLGPGAIVFLIVTSIGTGGAIGSRTGNVFVDYQSQSAQEGALGETTPLFPADASTSINDSAVVPSLSKRFEGAPVNYNVQGNGTAADAPVNAAAPSSPKPFGATVPAYALLAAVGQLKQPLNAENLMINKEASPAVASPAGHSNATSDDISAGAYETESSSQPKEAVEAGDTGSYWPSSCCIS